MAMSKVWLSLTPEERKVKRKTYRENYEKNHPEKVKENTARYRLKHKVRLRVVSSANQKKRGRANKLRAIEYLGGQCTDCGQKYHPSVYDFHHIDPNEKDIGIARIGGRTFENIIPELDKCVLLCANCHRLRHHIER